MTSQHSISNHSDSHEHAQHKPDHSHRRVFIGPLPENVMSNFVSRDFPPETTQTKGWFTTASRQDTVESNVPDSHIVRELTRSFFLREGGKQEDWNEDEEEGVRQEMLRRWKESEWGSAIHRRRRQRKKISAQETSRWVGGSFEVGGLLGMNIIQEATDVLSRKSAPSSVHASSSPEVSTSAARTSNAETFVTARTDPSTSTPPPLLRVGSPHLPHSPHPPTSFSDSPMQLPVPDTNEAGKSTTSLTPLVQLDTPQKRPSTAPGRPATAAPPRPPILKVSSLPKSDFITTTRKGKQKVHYAESPMIMSPLPASPTAVLERSGSDVIGTSAGAMSQDEDPDDEFMQGGIIRDRMYVRVKHSDSLVNIKFDEEYSRTSRNLSHEDWEEYIVIWRNGRIELYDDYKLSLTEKLLGHKHLAYIIDLNAPETRLSLYSFTDMSFSLTCVPVSPHRFQLFRDDGRNIFVFKHRSRSRACDWLWHIWRHRGGELPSTLEVWNPSLNAKIKFPVPHMDMIDSYKNFSRENVLQACMSHLRERSDYKDVIERQLQDGKVLELAWRVEASLDWIWLDDTVFGDPRKWSVLCGLAFEQDPPAHLELRLGTHFPNWLPMREGSRLTEPPSIEGYLDRIRPATQTKQAVYLATHNGHLFTISPAHANPPSPLGLHDELSKFKDLTELADSIKHNEVERGAEQIKHAYGVSDFTNIVAVRRAFSKVPIRQHDERQRTPTDEEWLNVWSVVNEPSDSDNEDEGGDEGLAHATDVVKMRTMRSFELLLDSGQVIRFEAHSRKVALEWVERLKELTFYWKARRRVDAKEEMEVAKVVRAPITPPRHAHQNDADLPPLPPPDPSLPLPGLGPLYNWCVLEGCKPILKMGNLFMRRSLRGHYKVVDLVLMRGSLAWFKIHKGSLLHTAAKKKINLGNAYVLSGFLAAQLLPRDQFQDIAALRYGDGLEADDDDVDRLFVILYYSQKYSSENPPKLPLLKMKRKMAVFKTRSKLERDSWCWALNCEIERIMRSQPEYEDKLRNQGIIPTL